MLKEEEDRAINLCVPIKAGAASQLPPCGQGRRLSLSWLFLASPPLLLPPGRSQCWEPQAGSAEEEGLRSERYGVPRPGLPGRGCRGWGLPHAAGLAGRVAARPRVPWASRPRAALPVPVGAAGHWLPASLCLGCLGACRAES